MLDTGLHCSNRLFRRPALGNVRPRPDYLLGLAVLIADKALLVVHPAPAAVLLEEAVLNRVLAFPEQLHGLGFHGGEVVRVDATSPEVRAFQILARLVAQQVLDVLADEGRGEIAKGLVAVDDRARRGQEMNQPVLGGHRDLAQLLAGRHVLQAPTTSTGLPAASRSSCSSSLISNRRRPSCGSGTHRSGAPPAGARTRPIPAERRPDGSCSRQKSGLARYSSRS